MLSKVIIKNFKSIEELNLDLSFAEKKAPNGHKNSDILYFLEPIKNDTKNRIVPTMNIYGANASGKSNIVHSLFCFKRVFISGINSIPKELFSINKLKNLGNNTYIELEFFIKKNIYKYKLSYNNYGIETESLLLNNKSLFYIENTKSNFKGIAIKNFDEETLNDIFQVSCISPVENNNSVQINTFLSAITYKLPGLNNQLNIAFNYLKNSIQTSLGNNIPSDFAIDKLSKNKESIDKSFEKISQFIKKLDIDIERFEYKRDFHSLENFKSENNKLNIPKIRNQSGISKSCIIDEDKNLISFSEIIPIHKNYSGEEVSFRFNEESIGTQLSFGLAGIILQILETGGVIIIDELDRSLHPLLLKSLIRVFKDKDYNKNNAQLICTLHTTDILEDDIYKISEFAFINKNPKRGSFIKRLSDFPSMRNDMNFRDRYLNGLYSGIPHPYN